MKGFLSTRVGRPEARAISRNISRARPNTGLFVSSYLIRSRPLCRVTTPSAASSPIVASIRPRRRRSRQKRRVFPIEVKLLAAKACVAGLAASEVAG